MDGEAIRTISTGATTESDGLTYGNFSIFDENMWLMAIGGRLQI